MSVLLSLVTLAPALQATAQADDANGMNVAVFHLDPARSGTCAEAVDAFLNNNGVVSSSPQAVQTRQQICVGGIESIVLMVPKPAAPAPSRVITIDVMGGASSGNANNANAGGAARFADKFGGGKHKLDINLKGEYRLETTDKVETTYHSFEVNGNYELVVGDHWAIFGYAALGRDTKKEIAITANGQAGVTFNVFGNGNPRTLKVSVGTGLRHEELLNGVIATASNGDFLPASNGILSYRARYEEGFFKDTISLIAGAMFTHVLFAPETANTEAHFFDVSDYRFLSELTIRFTIAEIRGVKLQANVGGTYEYFANTAADSNYDLVLKGGVGVSF